jgi:2-oxoglutarate ferredoxin oxidoreductase subunit delta
LCLVVCPRKNLKKGETANAAGAFPVIVIDGNDCTGCGMCFLMCPDVAIEVAP